MKMLYYYKRADGTCVFQDGMLMKERDALKHLIKHRKAGYTVWRLYLDLPEDFDKIRSLFFNEDYWVNKTWEDENNER